MTTRRVASFVLITFVAVAFGWYGCSDNSNETIVSADSLSNANQSAVLDYFPLDEGYTTVFSVHQSNGAQTTATFKVGKAINYYGKDVIEWIGSENGRVDTGYFQATETSLLFYDSYNSDAEVVLELPLRIGASWARFDDQTGTDTDPYIDISAGGEDDGGGTSAKVFPTDGGSSMVVEGYENLTLDNGYYYSEVLRVANATSNGLGKNYYWYSPGYGLIRYALGVTDATYPDGFVVGEVINFYR